MKQYVKTLHCWFGEMTKGISLLFQGCCRMALLLITSDIEEDKYTSAIFFLICTDFQHVTQMISENASVQ